MSALAFVLYRSFVNIVKSLIKHPSALIGYIIIICLVLFPSLIGTNGQPGFMINLNIVKAVFMGYIIFLFLIALVSSLSGSSFFRMADVNLLFTSPINAGYILMYGFLKQLGTNIFVMLFLALQYPNWKRMFGFNPGAGWVLIVSYMLLLMFTSLLGMVLYSYVSKNPERLDVVRRGIYGLCIAFVLPIGINLYRTGDIANSAVGWLSNDSLRFIPFIGWFRELFLGVYTGFTREIVFYIILMSLTIFGILAYLYRMDTDYYEQVLCATELRETLMKSFREGKTAGAGAVRKYRKVKGSFTLEGSLAIFQRQMLEKRRSGYWLISGKTIVLVICGIIAAVSIRVDSIFLMLGICGVTIYIMLLFTFATMWESSLSSHYIYMIPASPISKMFSATLPDLISVAIEAVLLFGLVGVLLRVPLGFILSVIFAYMTIGAVFTYSDMFVRRLFGKIHGNVLRIFFRIFLLIIVVLLSVLPAIIYMVSTGNYIFGLLFTSMVNIILVLIFALFGVGLFASPELA
jgi:hypothetical protein